MFVTSQGSPYARFRRALETGNLMIVRAAAAELPAVQLGDALRVLCLMRGDQELYERAAVRWLGRFCLEALAATLDRINVAGAALASLEAGQVEAEDDLREVCQASGVPLPR